MTYILGSIYNSGGVIIGDRKTVSIDGTITDYDEKLFYDHPIVMGSSGTVSLSKKLRAEIQDYLIKNEINSVNKFMRDIEDIAESVRKRYSSFGDFDTLICLQIKGSVKIIQLHYPEYATKITEDVKKYTVIGSGEYYGRIFLKRLWRENMTMQQIAELGYFTIKYIEKFGLDTTVGVNHRGPQIWFIPNNDKIFEADDTLLGRLERLTQIRLEKYTENIDSLFNVEKLNIDWSKLTKKEMRIRGLTK